MVIVQQPHSLTGDYLKNIGTATLKAAALEHGERLHPEGSKGRVIVAHKDGESWNQRSYEVSDLPDVIPAVVGLEDAYISQQRFHFRRTIAQLRELGALFCDLDFYKILELQGMDARGVLEDVLIALQRARIPSPSMAITSGRGLYVIWLHGQVPRAALPRWNACQRELWQVLKRFGADRGALDAAHVLRLAGTVNGKSGTIVEQIAPPGDVWQFDDLAGEILPLDREELYDLRIQRAAREARKPRESRQRPPMGFTQASLWEGRLRDLQMLRELRWFGDLPPGQRDLWMFLAGVGMSWIAIPQVLQRELWELSKEAGSWNDSESGSRLHAIMKRAHMAAKGERIEWNGLKVDPRYKFKNQTVIEWLEIEDWEMEEMSVLISSDEARRRDTRAQRARRRAAGVMPREEYETRAAARIAELAPKVADLQRSGATYREIARVLKVSLRDVTKCVGLYGGVASPEGAKEELGRERKVPKSVLIPFLPEERRDKCGSFTSGEQIRLSWEDGQDHPLGCDCLECSTPAPRYALSAG